MSRHFSTNDPTPVLGLAIVAIGLVIYGIASVLGWSP